jgi:hypothetical protein
MSVFTSIESLIVDDTLDEIGRKRIVAKEIAAFKKLKEQVEAQKNSDFPPSQATPSSKQPGVAALLENEDFKNAMNEVEARLTAQVKELKSQLVDLQKDLDLLRKA